MEINKLATFSLTLLLALGLVRSQGSFEYCDKDLASEDSKKQLYDRWRTHYKIQGPEKLDVFKSNLDHVDHINKAGKSYTLKLNKFADTTNEDFLAKRTGVKSRHHKVQLFERPGGQDSGPPPPTVDWKKDNAVTPVKDQGECGSSWAFATVGALESLNAINTKKPVTLSEQTLVDCDRAQTNKGCDGGTMVLAYDFIKKNGGIPTDADYPYKGPDGTCNQEKSKAAAVKIDGYKTVNVEDENLLMKAVAKNPVAAAIDATGLDIQLYGGGIFNGECGSTINHGVVVVGYGEEGAKFYTLKNSWGPEWGEEGYMRIERQIADKKGKCGIALESLYPTMPAGDAPKQDL